MKTHKILILLWGAALLFNSCSKTGATGPTGPAGTNGTNGKNGVANIHDTVYTIATSSWTSSGVNWVITVNDLAISDPLNDVILGYYNATSSTSTSWNALPAMDTFISGDVLTFNYAPTSIQLVYRGTSPPSRTLYFKFVVIPPAVMKRYPNINLGNYAEVQSFITALKND